MPAPPQMQSKQDMEQQRDASLDYLSDQSRKLAEVANKIEETERAALAALARAEDAEKAKQVRCRHASPLQRRTMRDLGP